MAADGSARASPTPAGAVRTSPTPAGAARTPVAAKSGRRAGRGPLGAKAGRNITRIGSVNPADETCIDASGA